MVYAPEKRKLICNLVSERDCRRKKKKEITLIRKSILSSSSSSSQSEEKSKTDSIECQAEFSNHWKNKEISSSLLFKENRVNGATSSVVSLINPIHRKITYLWRIIFVFKWLSMNNTVKKKSVSSNVKTKTKERRDDAMLRRRFVCYLFSFSLPFFFFDDDDDDNDDDG